VSGQSIGSPPGEVWDATGGIVRTYPVGAQTYTERAVQYRTATYVVLIRLDAFADPEPAFLAFAQTTSDGLKTLTPMR